MIARATSGGGGVIKGCTDIKQETLGIRREGEESNLEPGIVMGELIESAGKENCSKTKGYARTIHVKIHRSKQV